MDAFGETALAGCEKTMLACQTRGKGATGGTSEMGKTRGSPVCPRRALVRLAYSSSILLARLGEIIEMGQRVAKGTTHGRRQPLAAFHSKHSLRLSSCFPVFHMPPRTEYRAKDNAQQFQDVSAPGTQNIAQTSTYILKQYDTQGDNGGGGY